MLRHLYTAKSAHLLLALDGLAVLVDTGLCEEYGRTEGPLTGTDRVARGMAIL